MKNFMNFLSKQNPSMYQVLAKHPPGSKGFNNAWSSIAKSNAKEFDRIQHGFIKSSHYDPAVNALKNTIGFDVNKYSPALQNVLWSTATQHGIGGAQRVFKNAGIKSGMSEAEIIRRVYQERGANNGKKYFARSSDSIRMGVVNRFRNEMQDALNMLG